VLHPARVAQQRGLVGLACFEGVGELGGLAGVQLGAGSLKESAGLQRKSERQRELASLARLELRIRNKTSELVTELLAGWMELAESR